FEGQCAQLCGVFHASMLATVVAQSDAAYRHFVDVTTRATLGQQEWSGVCATCHGNLGQGGYGPVIANNSLLTQPSALEGIVRNGSTGTQGAMPPVGKGWTHAQMAALATYVKRHTYKPAPVGGTSGG